MEHQGSCGGGGVEEGAEVAPAVLADDHKLGLEDAAARAAGVLFRVDPGELGASARVHFDGAYPADGHFGRRVRSAQRLDSPELCSTLGIKTK